jgi:hypothetical protein
LHLTARKIQAQHNKQEMSAQKKALSHFSPHLSPFFSISRKQIISKNQTVQYSGILTCGKLTYALLW